LARESRRRLIIHKVKTKEGRRAAVPELADCNIYVRSRRAGERVMASVSRFLTNRLRLKVNEACGDAGGE
jgi:hypothetical protein